MTVKELIEKLSTLNPDLMVVVRGYEGGVNEVTKLDNIKVALNNPKALCGDHEKIEDFMDKEYIEDYLKGKQIVSVLEIVGENQLND